MARSLSCDRCNVEIIDDHEAHQWVLKMWQVVHPADPEEEPDDLFFGELCFECYSELAAALDEFASPDWLDSRKTNGPPPYQLKHIEGIKDADRQDALD